MTGWQGLVAERYRLREPLGTGGMGRVWLARDEMLHRDVAIKELVLPHGLSPQEHEELQLRTMREARAAAQLSHPNVIQIYDVIQSEAQPWIVMEYVRSRSLHEIVRRRGPLPPQTVADIGLAILAALRAAHSAGVLHRDVKPGNVLLAEDGRVVLTDFGLAAFESGEGQVTRPGLVLGSPQYVAPERARDGVSSVEADLWSLGATLYAAVEGHAPYARETAMATLTALATESPEPARRAGPLRPVLDGLLRKNPRLRMTAAEAEQLLRRVAAGDQRIRRRVPRPRRPESASGAITAGLDGAPTSVVAAPSGSTTDVVLSFVARRKARLALVAAGVVLVTFVVAVVIARPSGRDNPLSAGTPPAGASRPGGAEPSGGGTAGGTAIDYGASGCPFVAGSPAPTSTRAHTFSPLPGWQWFDDDTARYSIAVPELFTYARTGRLNCFMEPGGSRMVAVEQLGQTVADPTAFCAEREKAMLNPLQLPGYQRVGLKQLDFWAGAAEWEYTFDGSDGTRMHGVTRAFLTKPGHAFAIYWVARDFDWQTNLSNYRAVTPSFTPWG